MLESYVPRRVLGVIPARFASTRFPGKPLAALAGKPLIQHVFERTSQSRYLSRIVVATDDARIADAARRFHAPVVMTRSDHISGTDRAAEVASADTSPIIVNIQGDEPLIDPAAIDAAILGLLDDEECQMGTLKKRIEDPSEVGNPNVVKVVTDHLSRALYFSRSPIPYQRPGSPDPRYFKHIGLYVYRRDFLLGYSDLKMGPLEETERLEQLRALENGFPIQVSETDYHSIGVDTPEDLETVSRLLQITQLQNSRHG